MVTMTISLAYMLFFTTMSDWMKALVVFFMLAAAIYILSQKSRPPEESR
jgi:uncharacterized membrane protein YfcA